MVGTLLRSAAGGNLVPYVPNLQDDLFGVFAMTKYKEFDFDLLERCSDEVFTRLIYEWQKENLRKFSANRFAGRCRRAMFLLTFAMKGERHIDKRRWFFKELSARLILARSQAQRLLTEAFLWGDVDNLLDLFTLHQDYAIEELKLPDDHHLWTSACVGAQSAARSVRAFRKNSIVICYPDPIIDAFFGIDLYALPSGRSKGMYIQVETSPTVINADLISPYNRPSRRWLSKCSKAYLQKLQNVWDSSRELNERNGNDWDPVLISVRTDIELEGVIDSPSLNEKVNAFIQHLLLPKHRIAQ